MHGMHRCLISSRQQSVPNFTHRLDPWQSEGSRATHLFSSAKHCPDLRHRLERLQNISPTLPVAVEQCDSLRMHLPDWVQSRDFKQSSSEVASQTPGPSVQTPAERQFSEFRQSLSEDASQCVPAKLQRPSSWQSEQTASEHAETKAATNQTPSHFQLCIRCAILAGTSSAGKKSWNGRVDVKSSLPEEVWPKGSRNSTP